MHSLSHATFPGWEISQVSLHANPVQPGGCLDPVLISTVNLCPPCMRNLAVVLMACCSLIVFSIGFSTRAGIVQKPEKHKATSADLELTNPICFEKA
jgi:hypothetical protein